jgi:predicted amidohydrolase YtcJ
MGAGDWSGPRTGEGDDWLRIGSLKLFADGALGTRTALMLDPYLEHPGYRGVATLEAGECRDLIERAARGGLATAVHAIGDAANRLVLDAFAATRHTWESRGLVQRIEHAQLLSQSDLPRLATLGIVASMQPVHAVSDYLVADRYWGDRCDGAYAWRSLLDAGTVLAFGSDAPVESIDPLPGIHAALTRQRSDGSPTGGWLPQQRLSVGEALTGYTSGAARASGEQMRRGRIAPGYLADFAVLAGDGPLAEPAFWLSARVRATVVGGVVVHGCI